MPTRPVAALAPARCALQETLRALILLTGGTATGLLGIVLLRAAL